jgi:hypothetical protein
MKIIIEGWQDDPVVIEDVDEFEIKAVDNNGSFWNAYYDEKEHRLTVLGNPDITKQYKGKKDD